MKKVKGEDLLSQAESMIHDVQKMDDQSRAFNDFVNSRDGLRGQKTKLSVVPLLCSSAWPIKLMNQTIQLPPLMDTYAKLFTEFFDATSNADKKKSLTLMHQYGRSELSFLKYKLNGTEFHLIILPLIKCSGIISLKQLVDATHLHLEDIKSQIAFLIHNNIILGKNDEKSGAAKFDKKNRDTWSESTLIKANAKFVHPKNAKEFTIAVKKDERSTQAAAVTKEDISAAFEGYKLCSEANMVRIMKTRKDFSVNELFSSTMKDVARWFDMNRKIFDAALSDLIDQEIIARNESGDKVQYIA